MRRTTLKYAVELQKQSRSCTAQARAILAGMYDDLAVCRPKIKRSKKQIQSSDLLICNLAQCFPGTNWTINGPGSSCLTEAGDNNEASPPPEKKNRRWTTILLRPSCNVRDTGHPSALT